MSLTDDALEQVGRLFKENAELRERVEQVATQRDEWHRQNGLLRGERDAATARAEQAEAEAQRLHKRNHWAHEARKASLAERDEWRRAFDAEHARAEQAEAVLAEMRERLTCGNHCADVERERDEYRIELEQFRHEKAEREARNAERKPVSIGTGMPGTSHLEAFGQYLRDAFGTTPYHVGSSIHGKTWRDVDVRVMLDDDRFDALFPGYASRGQRDAWWSLLCAALSVLGEQRTGLPIDCQVQRTSDANEKYPGARNPLFVGLAEDDHRPTMVAPATPFRREITVRARKGGLSALKRAADEQGEREGGGDD